MDDIKKLVKEAVESLDYYLYDVQFKKRDGDYVLTVEIDHTKPVGIDDCVKVSERVSQLMDEHDPIEQAYMLEVTSAGAEHPLRHLDDMKLAIGKFVHIKTMDQTYEGTLVKADEADVVILDKSTNQTLTIAQTDIESIRLAVDF